MQTQQRLKKNCRYTARPIVTIESGGEHYIIAPRSGFIDVYDVKTGKIKTTFPDDLKGIYRPLLYMYMYMHATLHVAVTFVLVVHVASSIQ